MNIFWRLFHKSGGAGKEKIPAIYKAAVEAYSPAYAFAPKGNPGRAWSQDSHKNRLRRVMRRRAELAAATRKMNRGKQQFKRRAA